MAESDSTLGTPFAQRKFLAKPFNLNSTESLDSILKPIFGLNSEIALPSFLDNTLPGSMETLRSHINYLLSLPLPTRERKRLIKNYWELEFLIEETGLLLDQVTGDPLLDFLDQDRSLKSGGLDEGTP